jgi:hypothetical protein
MTRYKVSIAVMAGTAVTSIALLMLNISFIFYTLLTPGAVAVNVICGFDYDPSAAALIMANAFFYSCLAGATVASNRFRSMDSADMRTLAIRLAIPALFLFCLACIPAVSPIWPRGMTALKKMESELQQAINAEMSLEQSRAVLKSNGIVFSEEREKVTTSVFRTGALTISAVAGDTLVFSNMSPQASQYPCGYKLEVVLVFGQDEKLRQRYISRTPVCP